MSIVMKKMGSLPHSVDQKVEVTITIHIHHELMSVENGLLTPTFKAKRTDVEKHFKPVIRKLYTELKSVPSVGSM